MYFVTVNKSRCPTPQTTPIYLFREISDYRRCWGCTTGDQPLNMPQKHILLGRIECLTVFRGCFMVWDRFSCKPSHQRCTYVPPHAFLQLRYNSESPVTPNLQARPQSDQRCSWSLIYGGMCIKWDPCTTWWSTLLQPKKSRPTGQQHQPHMIISSTRGSLDHHHIWTSRR